MRNTNLVSQEAMICTVTDFCPALVLRIRIVETMAPHFVAQVCDEGTGMHEQGYDPSLRKKKPLHNHDPPCD
jgi:hypothetical protein